MHEASFLKAYEGLNPKQREAVDAIEGPVMVIAGPGTGKTQILTLRIANILRKTDTAPESILALTFTESGARAMRERLALYVGPAAYRVRIHTFHEFAYECIREYPEAYTRPMGGAAISDLERFTLIESILGGGEIRHLRPGGNPQLYVKPAIDAISAMKREYVTPERFAEAIRAEEDALSRTPRLHEKGAHKGKVRGEYIDLEKRLNRNRELLFVYRAYDAALQSNGQFDYDDMIYETVEALRRDENMLRSLQERHQYILADEHQDVNGSQNSILELIASFHDRPNLFVVGDEKQSIYRFQGASLENFLYFGDTFKGAETIALSENYRSAQNILDLAHELITKDAGAAMELRVPLTAAERGAGIIERAHFSHEGVELAYVGGKVKALIETGVPPHEVAVIVRTNREVEEVAGHLRARGLHVLASADGDILAHPLTSAIRTLIEAALYPEREEALFQILHAGHVGLSTEDLVRVVSARSYDCPLSRIMEDPEALEAVRVKEPDKVLRIAALLKGARERTATEAPQRVLEHLLRESGLLDHVLARDPYEGSRVVRRLYDEIEEMVRSRRGATLEDALRMLETCAMHGIPLNAPYIRAGEGGVHVMTAHKAKGLEFLHVFVPHATDNRWGGGKRKSSFDIPFLKHLAPDSLDALDDERKLLYVALTRAKQGLYLSDAETNAEGRSLLPTRLLTEVGDGLIADVDTTEYEKAFEPAGIFHGEHTETKLDASFLRDILLERGLSATALNNYLADPWTYFYRNILRMPEVKSESAQFGTALHDTLRSIMKHRREKGALPTASETKAYLERELGKLPLSTGEFTRLHARGLEALLAYQAYIANSLPHETKEEFRIEAMLPTGDVSFPEVRLTGVLDRLDIDESGKVIRIVDYKTGKPRTKGQIEGTTKDSDGGYKRQLVFYALVLELYGDERLKSRDGLLSFIEADQKGKIHEEPYTVTDSEIKELRATIVRVALEIAHGAFLNAPCDPSSDYCELVSALKLRTAS